MYVSCSKFYWRFCHTLVNWKSVSQILCNLYTQCSMCPKKTFILPQKYHDSVLHMLSQLLKCVPKTKTNIYFSGQTCYWPLTKSWFKDFTLPHLESCSNTIPMTTVHVSVSIGFRTPATSKVEFLWEQLMAFSCSLLSKRTLSSLLKGSWTCLFSFSGIKSALSDKIKAAYLGIFREYKYVLHNLVQRAP